MNTPLASSVGHKGIFIMLDYDFFVINTMKKLFSLFFIVLNVRNKIESKYASIVFEYISSGIYITLESGFGG